MPNVLPYIPYQWRGGKDEVADQIWPYLGDPHVYCEPFGGRLDTLFHRPPGLDRLRIEVVGDLDSLLVNFFRAARHAPDELADLIDHDPISNTDFLARDHWLYDHRERIIKVLLSHPEACDLQAAQYWLYRQCLLPDTAPCKSKRQQMTLGFSVDCLKYSDNRELFRKMRQRLQKVRIINGDFRSTVRQTPRTKDYTYGYLFDPPYTEGDG